MIHTVEVDKQTASFVRQLEEQRRIEKNLMVERVRGAKEGLESVFHDIRERVEALERMTSSVSTSYIAPIGWSQLIFAGTDGNSNTILSGDRDDILCKHDGIISACLCAHVRLVSCACRGIFGSHHPSFP